MQPGAHISYKTLRKKSPEAARLAVLDYLESCEYNITKTANTFGITRRVVYNILTKEREGDLTDRPKTPHSQPRRTPSPAESAFPGPVLVKMLLLST